MAMPATALAAGQLRRGAVTGRVWFGQLRDLTVASPVVDVRLSKGPAPDFPVIGPPCHRSPSCGRSRHPIWGGGTYAR
jgi:hypothetical protein